MKTLEFTNKEMQKLREIKLKDPQNRCHHHWSEFILRIAKFYNQKKLKT